MRASATRVRIPAVVVLAAVAAVTACGAPAATPESSESAVHAVVEAEPTPTATYHPTLPQPATAPARVAPEPRLPQVQAAPNAFVMNLYRRRDFVAQARADWCVPASILTMMNMIDRGRDRSRPGQATLDRLARRLSSARLQGAGSEPEGWVRTLNKLGYGPYQVRAEPTRKAALRAAARAIRLTGRPVGLLMWRGAHAWVVSGFRATADPATTDDFAVTDIYVDDPWYPRVSSIWGRSRRPNARVAVEQLRGVYLPWDRAVRYVEKDGRFVLVVPVAR